MANIAIASVVVAMLDTACFHLSNITDGLWRSSLCTVAPELLSQEISISIVATCLPDHLTLYRSAKLLMYMHLPKKPVSKWPALPHRWAVHTFPVACSLSKVYCLCGSYLFRRVCCPTAAADTACVHAGVKNSPHAEKEHNFIITSLLSVCSINYTNPG